MWGNVKGWSISGFILAITLGLLYWGGTQDPISSSTGKLMKSAEATKLSVDPKPLAPDGANDCNAAELYRKAAADFQANRSYDHFIKAKPKNSQENAQLAAEFRSQVPQLEGVRDILEAAGCARFDLYASKPQEVVNYENKRPILTALESIGDLMILYAARTAKDDAPAANKYNEAVFVLGRRLYEERVVFDEYRIGVGLMNNAAHTMVKFTLPNDPTRAAQVGAFDEAVQGHLKKFETIWAAVSGIPEEGKLIAYPGDLFELAQKSSEPLWRTEALLKLGRVRWMGAVRYGDQIGANRTLRAIADQPNLPPPVKAAAIAGRDLDKQKFNLYGTGGS